MDKLSSDDDVTDLVSCPHPRNVVEATLIEGGSYQASCQEEGADTWFRSWAHHRLFHSIETGVTMLMCLQDEDGCSPPQKMRKTGKDRRKVKRVSAGEGLATVADSMEASMRTIANSLIVASGHGPTDSSCRKATAISAIEENEGLSDNEFNDAVEMIMDNGEAASMYLAIKNPIARTRFLQSQLQKARNNK